MKKKEDEILNNLAKMYKDLYLSKHLFSKEYFKYSPEEVEEVCINRIDYMPNEIKAKKEIRNDILLIVDAAGVKKFFLENLQYNREADDSKDECLKNISSEELKYLYSKIYSTPIKKNVRKQDILKSIEKYFASIERAMIMKP